MPLGIKIAELTEASSQIVTCDFVPKCGIVFSHGKTSDGTPAANCSHCIGFFDGSGFRSGAIVENDNVATTENAFSSSATLAGEVITCSAAAVATAGGINAIALGTSDVTFQWNTTGSAEKYVAIIFGGTGVQGYVGTWTPPASASSDSVTGVGFRGDVTFFQVTTPASDADPTSDATTGIAYTFGCATDTSQWVIGGSSSDGLASQVTIRYQRTNLCIGQHATTGAVLFDAEFDGFTDDGFDITVTESAGYESPVHFLVLKGVTAYLHSFNCNTSTGAQSITGMSFQPYFHLLASYASSASSSDRTSFYLNYGFMGRSQQAWQSAMLSITAPSSADSGGQVTSTGTDCFRIYTYAKGGVVTLRDAYTFTSNNSDGFSLNQGTASGEAKQIVACSLGDKPTVIIPGGIVPGGIVP